MTRPTNSVGVHALVWAPSTSTDEVALAAKQTKAAGFDLLELSLHDYQEMDIAAARTAIEAEGLSVACSRGLPYDSDISSDDPAARARGVEVLLASLDVTAALGGTVLTGVPYSCLRKYDRRLTPQARANIVAILRSTAQEAAARGVSLGLEIVNRYESNVINTARDALRLADDIGEDNVFLHLDTYHMNIEESDFSSPVLEVGDRLGYVHVGENQRGYLGSGSINFATFFHALATIGYAGPITFESFSSAVVSPTLSIDLAVWRNMWSDGYELASSARAFIDAHVIAAVHNRAE